jgi:hypothetical protein
MSGESPARDGGLLDRRRGLTAAPRAGRSRRRRAVSAAAGAAALLAGLGGLAACAAPAPGVPVQPSATSSQRLPLSPIPGQLIGVSAGPGGSAWAAGSTTSGRALIVHWNGATWSQAASPSPGGAALLHGVSAAPGGSAWAAGDTCASGCGTSSEADRTLILRWDGLSWSQTASPSPGRTAFLYGVSASPDGSAWAVGYTGTSSGADRTLILRWDGLSWSRVASPSPGRDALLLGVSAGPGRTAWAVGDSCMSRCGTTSAVYRLLIMHWNGKAWSLVTGPGLGSDAYLYGVSAGPGGGAWAVGYICTSGCHTASEADQMLILRWDGTSWSRAAAPSLGSSALLDAVSAGAGGTAWAVGSSCTPGCLAPRAATRALILHWDGTAWSQAASPSPAGKAILTGVSAGPGGSAWAAGYTCTPGCFAPSEANQTLIMRWNGDTWAAG